jgi:hypothetical protein
MLGADRLALTLQASTRRPLWQNRWPAGRRCKPTFTTVAERQDEIERRHLDIRDHWPSVYTGVAGSSLHSFGLGIDAEFGDLAARLR